MRRSMMPTSLYIFTSSPLPAPSCRRSLIYTKCYRYQLTVMQPAPSLRRRCLLARYSDLGELLAHLLLNSRTRRNVERGEVRLHLLLLLCCLYALKLFQRRKQIPPLQVLIALPDMLVCIFF